MIPIAALGAGSQVVLGVFPQTIDSRQAERLPALLADSRDWLRGGERPDADR